MANGKGEGSEENGHCFVQSIEGRLKELNNFDIIQPIFHKASRALILFFFFPKILLYIFSFLLFCNPQLKLKIIFLMSSLTVSSKYVQVEANNMATVTIKNIKIDQTSPSSPILYKVKTNMKDLVDVRPSFGIVYSTPQQKSIVTLSIRFAGAVEQLEKAKLMISWSSTEDRKDLNGSKITHEEFNKILTTSKKIGEGSLILPFIQKAVAERKRMEENQSERANSLEEQESLPEMEKEREHEKQAEEKVETKPSESKLESVISERSSVLKEHKQKVVEVKGYSTSVVTCVFIIAFLLGLFVGTKIQTLFPHHANIIQSQAQRSIDVKVAVSSPEKSGEPAEPVPSDNPHPATQQTTSSSSIPPAVQPHSQIVEEVQIVGEEDQVDLDI